MAPTSQPHTRPATRFALIDAARGLAVLQMVVYHFIWDLDYFGWLDLAMNRDAPWIWWRAAIVTQFLLLVGISLMLREALKPASADFWKRWWQVALSAALVSAASALLFGSRFIFFGILHFVAVALLLTSPLLRLKGWLVIAGVAALWLGWNVQHPFFSDPTWSALGFATEKPRTEDYVPLFPWIGVVWLGAALANFWKDRAWSLSPSLRLLDQHAPTGLQWIGRWPLSIYLLHQPIMMGVLWAVKQWA